MTKHAPSGKIRTAKACEECRRRRNKCDGEEPCSSCSLHRTACTYRTQIRGTRAKTSRPVHKSTDVDTATRNHTDTISALPPSDSIAAEVPHEDIPSVSATQSHGASGSIEVYCGASSTFALIHDLYRRLRRSGKLDHLRTQHSNDEEGLDALRQRDLYFGNTTNLPGESQHVRFGNEWRSLNLAKAHEFCDAFYSSWHHLAPVTKQDAIERQLVETFQSDSAENDTASSSRAVVLAVIALGALASGQLAWAEVLHLAAKTSSHVLDETTTRESVVTTLLLALYQSSLGRSTASYVYLGAAARKAFAMGLHVETRRWLEDDDPGSNSVTRRSLMWSIYVHDCLISVSFGKKRAISASDIFCKAPVEHQLLSQMLQICRKLEECDQTIYAQKHNSLRDMWQCAQSLLESVQSTAKDLELASYAKDDATDPSDGLRVTILHALYYHTITLALRPFALASGKQDSSSPTANDKMWLREARRRGIAAAEDQIAFLSHRVTEIKQIRFLGFFLESSCMVLLHDSVCYPAHHASNVVSIREALDCLSQLVQGEPVTSAAASIKQTLRIVGHAIDNEGGNDDTSITNELPPADPMTMMGALPCWGSQFDDSLLNSQSLFLSDTTGVWDQWLFTDDDAILPMNPSLSAF